MPVAKEQIRHIISENNLNSVADVYALLRNSFKNILQELPSSDMKRTSKGMCRLITNAAGI